MAHGEFIWCDLSAYEPERAMSFYSSAFGWSWSDQLESGYYLAVNGTAPAASLFEMPEKFVQMGMPSFWMSYISVDDAEAVVELAKSMGGKVELGPEEYPGGGRFALIRDPLGAGFTVLQDMPGSSANTLPGSRLGHALFVSDAGAVIPFYERLFGWKFQEARDGVFPVELNGGHLFHCHEIPDPAVRGKEQYWAVLFGRASADDAIARAGGFVDGRFALPEGQATLIRDPDGAAFVVVETGRRAAIDVPWLAWAGLLLVGVSVFTSHLWPWVIFLSAWVFQGVRDGETYLIQKVARARHPLLFWLTIGSFAALAILCAFYPFGGY